MFGRNFIKTEPINKEINGSYCYNEIYVRFKKIPRPSNEYS